MKTLSTRLSKSIFLILLVNLSGLIGILSGFEDFFIHLSPYALLLNFMLILYTLYPWPWQLGIAFLLCFGLGFLAEFLGVHYGLLFGKYKYGNNLGIKLAGVPLMIGINWVTLTFSAAGLARLMTTNYRWSVLLSACLMVLIDLPIEVMAPSFDYWVFEGGVAPFQNYVGWFAVSLFIQSIYQLLVEKENRLLAFTIYAVILVFFSALVLVA